MYDVMARITTGVIFCMGMLEVLTLVKSACRCYLFDLSPSSTTFWHKQPEDYKSIIEMLWYAIVGTCVLILGSFAIGFLWPITVPIGLVWGSLYLAKKSLKQHKCTSYTADDTCPYCVDPIKAFNYEDDKNVCSYCAFLAERRKK